MKYLWEKMSPNMQAFTLILPLLLTSFGMLKQANFDLDDYRNVEVTNFNGEVIYQLLEADDIVQNRDGSRTIVLMDGSKKKFSPGHHYSFEKVTYQKSNKDKESFFW